MNPTVVLRRVLELLATLLMTSFVMFAALYVVPGSPIAYLTRGRATDAQTIERIKVQYDLNEPFFPRYWHWLTGLFQGHLGTSLVSNEPTWTLLQSRMTTTAMLVLLATVETVVVGVLLGVVAALSRRAIDATITIGSTIGMGIPGFAAAAALISVFAVSLGWFPLVGSGSGFFGHLDHVVLPSVALAISSVAYMTRLTRSAVREERSKEYVDTANARGLPPAQIVRRHVLRNALPSILTAGGVSFVGLMASEVVVESAFGLNGMGSLLVQSVEAKDFAVVQVLVLMYVAVFMVVNTLIDVVAMKVDPRLAREAGGS